MWAIACTIDPYCPTRAPAGEDILQFVVGEQLNVE
jgi:hypothetical protein